MCCDVPKLLLAESSSAMSDDDDSLGGGGGEQRQHDALKDIKIQQEAPGRREWAQFAILLVEQDVASDSERMDIVKECLEASGWDNAPRRD